MSSFIGLLKKDLSISRYLFFTWLGGVNILFMIGSFIVANYIDEPITPLGCLVMLILLHTIFIPILVLASLRVEGKTQIWLYNPQSSAVLLYSKIAAAFIYQCISQCLVWIFGLIAFAHVGMPTKFPITEMISSSILLTAIGLYIACWIIFYWSIYHSLGKYPKIMRLRWVFILVIFIILNIIETQLLKIKVFKDFINSWSFPLDINPSFNYTSHAWSVHTTAVDIPIIPIFLYVIIAIILLTISSWLLDRKVEV
ncbi:hypothetical protein [Heyndrickxia vini]|uniref:ABC transporter permease n=1 Tax=Heyndrickxia vini TaxID=1476025 RepID=A0ABX7E4V0_9BACI|nr:hypothetical protein [Heyndrickxia vini]QQZ10756.1 hypothetical protein I5776_07640 [Heyndrickxia vini]